MGRKCQDRNQVGSVVLDRHTGGYHFKLWSSLSGASLRRMIIDAMRCGGGSLREKQSAKVTIGCSKPRNPIPVHQCATKIPGSDKLSELLKLSQSSENEEDVRKKVEALDELKSVVKRLQSCLKDDVIEGARDVRRLTKDDPMARATLALLGAIPPLVALLDETEIENEEYDLSSQISALYALLNLGIGNDANKAAIVKAGAVHKMLKLIEPPRGSPRPAVAEAIAANFLGLSALDSNKPIIGSSGAISFLVKTIKDSDKRSSSQARQDALRALYNLSILPSNVVPILETDLVRFILSKLGDMDVSERILSILSNMVSSAEGRKAISAVPDAFPILIDVLNWTDSPQCQEKASYILMVMAHKAYGDRQTMVEAGIVSSLLELTLLGSTLAQKRASRILECLRVDKGKQVSENFNGGGLSATLSAPLCGPASSSSIDPNNQLKDFPAEDSDMMSEERKAVKDLVQQSLQNNMKRIVKRANLPHDFVPSEHFKSLTSSSTSKSLPF